MSSALKRGSGRKDAPSPRPSSALRRGERYPDSAALQRKKQDDPPARPH